MGKSEKFAQTSAAESALTTRGAHHLALTTTDIKQTIDFYVNVIGMPLIHAMKVPRGLGTGPRNRGNPPYEEIRHYFFDMGNDSTLGFFEIPEESEPQANRNAIGGMQHCAFSVTRKRFAELEQRLNDNGIAHSGVIPQLPGLLGIYFYDPNGIRLEFACQPDDDEAPQVIPCMTQTKAQARAELDSLGAGAEWVEAMLAGMPD